MLTSNIIHYSLVYALDFLGYASDVFVSKSEFKLLILEATIAQSIVLSYI